MFQENNCSLPQFDLKWLYISKVNITNNMFMYCKKGIQKRLADYDQRFSLNEPVLPLRELYVECSLRNIKNQRTFCI